MRRSQRRVDLTADHGQRAQEVQKPRVNTNQRETTRVAVAPRVERQQCSRGKGWGQDKGLGSGKPGFEPQLQNLEWATWAQSLSLHTFAMGMVAISVTG